MMRAHALGDPAMVGRGCLEPDVLDTQFGQYHQRHQAGRQVGADAHDGMGKIGRPELQHHAFVGGVRLYRMGQAIRPLLDQFGVVVDAHDVMAKTNEGLRDRAAEPPQADHEYAVALGEGVLLCKNSTQQLDAPPDIDSSCAAR